MPLLNFPCRFYYFSIKNTITSLQLVKSLMVGNTFTRCCIRYSYKFQCQLMTFINFQRFIEFVTSLSTFVKGFTLNRLNSCDLLLKYSKMPKNPYYSRPCNYHKSKLCLIRFIWSNLASISFAVINSP